MSINSMCQEINIEKAELISWYEYLNLKKGINKFSHGGLHRDATFESGQWHPLVEFNNGSPIDKINEPCLPMSDYADALSRLSRWLVNDGKFQKHGVAVRAVALNYFLNPESVDCTSQKDLAKRLGVTEQRVATVVSDFERKFKFKVFSSHTQ